MEGTKRFLRFAAILDLIFYAIGVVIFVVYWVSGKLEANNLLNAFYLAIIVIFGPVPALLIVLVVDIHDHIVYKEQAKPAPKKPSYEAGDVVILTAAVTTIDQKKTLPMGSIGKVSKQYTDYLEVCFKDGEEKRIAHVPHESVRKYQG
ncbi:MAG: hypothetical protein J6M95_00135 [Bacilli bacterium]|nr:hypothetical protein [Bacilli bacterium]